MNAGPELARLMARRGIRDESVLAALASVPRERFVPERLRRHAYADRALPIGSGQTISQPYMVATHAGGAGATRAARVLDVGTGSGYQAAVLAELADEVVSIERVPELAEKARRTLAAARVRARSRASSATARSACRSTRRSTGSSSPRLLRAVPEALYGQLAPGGRLVVPVGCRREQWLEIVERGPDGPERVAGRCRAASSRSSARKASARR